MTAHGCFDERKENKSEGRGVIVRRGVLVGAAVSLLPCRAKGQARDMRVDALADELAKEMEARHGGAWVTHIDHENGYLFIRQKFSD